MPVPKRGSAQRPLHDVDALRPRAWDRLPPAEIAQEQTINSCSPRTALVALMVSAASRASRGFATPRTLWRGRIGRVQNARADRLIAQARPPKTIRGRCLCAPPATV